MLLPLLLLPFVVKAAKETLVFVDESFKPSLSLLNSLESSKSVQFGPLKKTPILFDAEDLVASPTHRTILIFSRSLPAQLSSSDLIEHVRRGGNLMVAVGGAVDEPSFRNLFKNFGVDLLQGKFETFDTNDKLEVNPLHALNGIQRGNEPSAPSDLVGFRLQNDPFKESSFNALIHPLYSLAPHQGFCSENTCAMGAAAATLESRNGARVMILGSPALAQEAHLQWLQGDLAKITIQSFEHELAAEGELKNRGISDLESTIYRINDQIKVKLCLLEQSGKQFVPQNLNDYQVELRMMTIHARIPFESVSEDGCLSISSLPLPDTPAVYTLRFQLRRPGWSVLNAEQKILLRPFRHDEYRRFLGVALPYYLSWASLLGATFALLMPMILFKSLQGKKVNPEKKNQ